MCVSALKWELLSTNYLLFLSHLHSSISPSRKRARALMKLFLRGALDLNEPSISHSWSKDKRQRRSLVSYLYGNSLLISGFTNARVTGLRREPRSRARPRGGVALQFRAESFDGTNWAASLGFHTRECPARLALDVEFRYLLKMFNVCSWFC